MTYEEVKEITRRLEWLEASELLFDIRLDGANMDDYPEFYYYHAQIKMNEENNEDVLVELLINEDPMEEEIRLEKCDGRFINEEYIPKQQEFYDACKLTVRDYINGNLVGNEVNK